VKSSGRTNAVFGTAGARFICTCVHVPAALAGLMTSTDAVAITVIAASMNWICMNPASLPDSLSLPGVNTHADTDHDDAGVAAKAWYDPASLPNCLRACVPLWAKAALVKLALKPDQPVEPGISPADASGDSNP